MKISTHFDLRELMCPEIFNHPAIGERSIDFINANAVQTLEDVREFAGPATINNWHEGGNYTDSGYRSAESNTGSSFSSHRMGCGFDLKFQDKKAVDVYYHILNNQHLFPYISRMENAEMTLTWLHVEICTHKREGDIIIFNPR